MKKLLIVVDYQNDFINGSLGFEGADSIYPFIKEKISEESVRRNQEEIKELGGHAFVLTSKNLEKEDDDLVVPECREDLSLLLKVMVVQYLAYYLALEKGLNPDEPRNLSKAVTI
jgi:glucosamine 6-phosphate synthetase-like amidotransferase/phosphosugar isomerase protein